MTIDCWLRAGKIKTMEEQIEIYQAETKPAEDANEVMLTYFVCSTCSEPTNWLSYSLPVRADVGDSYYTKLDSVTYLRGQAWDSLKHCNQRYEELIEASPGFAAVFDAVGLLEESTPLVLSFATPFVVPTHRPNFLSSGSYAGPNVASLANPELMRSLTFELLQYLRSRIRLLAETLRFLISLVSLLVRRARRPTFEHTFLGMQKAFHLGHGAHPPRNHPGLSSGRRPSLFGGCGIAIPSVTV